MQEGRSLLSGQLLVLTACTGSVLGLGAAERQQGRGWGRRLGKPSWAWVRVTGWQNSGEAVKGLSRAQAGLPVHCDRPHLLAE